MAHPGACAASSRSVGVVVSRPPLDGSLRQLLTERAGPDGWTYGMLCLVRDAAAIGDELGYERGKAEAFEEAATWADERLDDAIDTLSDGSGYIDAAKHFRALAAALREGGE